MELILTSSEFLVESTELELQETPAMKYIVIIFIQGTVRHWVLAREHDGGRPTI